MKAITTIVNKEDVDSPVYTFLHGLKPPFIETVASAGARTTMGVTVDTRTASSAHDPAIVGRPRGAKRRVFDAARGIQGSAQAFGICHGAGVRPEAAGAEAGA